MESKEKKTRSKRVDPKVKFGTTILEETSENIDLFRKQFPKEYKTPGQVVDMMAGLCLRINSEAAKELHDFCLDRAVRIERQLLEPGVGEWEADGLRDERDYLRNLANHMARFYESKEGDDKRIAMKRVDLQDGSYVIIPKDWIVANEGDASSSSYAFVVEIAHSKVPDLPHVVILSPKAHCSNADAVSLAVEASPAIRRVLEREVEPQCDEDGNVLNEDAVRDNPIPGVFPIRDATSYKWGDKAPYGAMVYRH